jgi:hypothetical protein
MMSNGGAIRRHHTLVVHVDEPPMVAEDETLTWAMLPPDDKSVVAPFLN